MGRLSLVTCYFLSFADVWGRRTGCDFLDLGDGVGLSPTMAQEEASVGCDFYSGETLVWMFCRLGNAVKKLFGDLLTVHQRKCMKGKIETFSRLASDEITNLWVKLCNLCKV
jgi:hypothetical protein